VTTAFGTVLLLALLAPAATAVAQGSREPALTPRVAIVAKVGGALAHNLLTALTGPAADTILPPDTVPHALFDSLGTVMASTRGIEPGPYRRDIVVVRFEPETPPAVRAALLDSISGHVVGGRVDRDRRNGSYFVRISGGTFDALVHAVTILQRQPQVANAFWWGLFVPDIQNRRPADGPGLAAAATSRDTATVRPVPARAPGSISSALWDSLTAPANLMTDPPGMHGTWARNVMMITFQPSATQADRQAVIDPIRGEVLGGNAWPMGEGEYIVRIPSATAPGDSISGPVLRTFLALRGHPSIMAAYPLSMDQLSKSH
jgi:hypothetical protein